jgi:uncharacterized membrane protein YraQ (UPF0718 family)
MLDQIFRISNFMVEAFLHIWPYLVVTIPLAVAVQMSGASKFIKRAFQARPLTAILLATIVGAFSPFCSCGVIPIIASLLIGMIGWKLAVWRLAATLVLSLSAGLITHWVMKRGWLGQQIWLGQQVLRTRKAARVQSTLDLIKKGWRGLKNSLIAVQLLKYATPAVSPPICAACSANVASVKNEQIKVKPEIETTLHTKGPAGQAQSSDCDAGIETFKLRLLKETLGATWMVVKFMALAVIAMPELKRSSCVYLKKRWVPPGWSSSLWHWPSYWRVLLRCIYPGNGYPLPWGSKILWL